MDAIGTRFPLRIPDTGAPPVNAAADAGADAGASAPAADATSATAARPPVGATSLWEVLTPEEREFFAQQSALGPLSYRPGGAVRDVASPPTGGRIDVRG